MRCPSHPIAHRLLEIFDRGQGKGLAAPSANSFGRISPSTAQHVRDDLGEKPQGKVDLIIDGGPCEVGIESTILDLSGDTPRILREGAIDSDQISSVIGKPVMHGTVYNSPRVSGTLKSHYAPKHKMEMVSAEDLPGKTQFLARQFKTFGLIAPEKIARRFKPISEKHLPTVPYRNFLLIFINGCMTWIKKILTEFLLFPLSILRPRQAFWIV